jgi:hypothetical protein
MNLQQLRKDNAVDGLGLSAEQIDELIDYTEWLIYYYERPHCFTAGKCPSVCGLCGRKRELHNEHSEHHPNCKSNFPSPLPCNCIPQPPATDDRQLCSPQHPKPKNVRGRWAHTNAHEIRDYGDTRRMRCDDCGEEWTEELPQ